MAAEFVIDAGRRLISTRFSGRMCLEEGLDYQRRLAADPAFDRTFRSLTDASEVTAIDLTGSQIELLVETHPMARDAPYAVIAPAPLTYGIVRMFQAYLEPRGLMVELFQDRASAERWLGLDVGD